MPTAACPAVVLSSSILLIKPVSSRVGFSMKYLRSAGIVISLRVSVLAVPCQRHLYHLRHRVLPRSGPAPPSFVPQKHRSNEQAA